MSATAVTLADITSADWSLKLGAIGQVVQGLADVAQCIAIILTTPKGSDPLRPTFGADIWRYIDYPVTRAIPAIVNELTQAITQGEPRVKLVTVNVAPAVDDTAQAGAHYEVTLTWQLRLGGVSAPTQTSSITIPAVG
ncbi:MAG TPA: GPW/gp25 family protein [Candidatus Binataceae bacterium]|nr:GPW/gp25 family protein [Candidatus Binataceae bacterium]